MSFVYFIKPVGMEGPIKIGCSRDPVKRLKQLMIWSPFPLEVAAAFPGDTQMESAMHHIFTESRLHGEWFAASTRLLETMAHIRDGAQIEDLLREEIELGKSGFRIASGLKSALTRKMNLAEAYASRNGIKPTRPDWVRHVVNAYSGPDRPAPTAEQTALVGLYVRELNTAHTQPDSPAKAAVA